jgi:hypothetical protein
MQQKILGYTLLAIGIIAILFTALSVYNVFSGKIQPISVIKEEALFSPPTTGESPNLLQMAGISGSTMSFIINLSFHLIFSGFIINVAFKIAQIGVGLVRPIVVDLNTVKQKEKKT